jgi:hypothetical protein
LSTRAGDYFALPQPFAQCGRVIAVAFQTKRAHVKQIALAPAFRNRQDVICIPERFAPANAPGGDSSGAGHAPQTLEMAVLSKTIDSANSTHAAIPLENPVAQMAGIAA